MLLHQTPKLYITISLSFVKRSFFRTSSQLASVTIPNLSHPEPLLAPGNLVSNRLGRPLLTCIPRPPNMQHIYNQRNHKQRPVKVLAHTTTHHFRKGIAYHKKAPKAIPASKASQNLFPPQSGPPTSTANATNPANQNNAVIPSTPATANLCTSEGAKRGVSSM